MKKLALSFRGGGARRGAYIGVLKALEENNIKIDGIIAGSAGALIAVAYGLGKTTDEILEYSSQFRISKLLNYNPFKKPFAIVDNNKFKQYIYNFIGDADINESTVPLYIETTNIETCEQKIFHKGQAKVILTASCAAPYFLSPVNIDGKLFFDGDVDSSFHTNFLREKGYDVILGVSANTPKSTLSIHSELMPGIQTLKAAQLRVVELEEKYEAPDIMLKNIGGKTSFFNFKDMISSYNSAYKAAELQIPKLLELLN